MKYCKKCGQQNNDQSTYCSACGEYLAEEEFSPKEEAVKFCPSCGSKIEQNYCPNCGAYVKNVSLDKGNMITDTIKKKASKSKKKSSIKNNKKFKICAIAGLILVVVALLANWIVQETVINPKKQKACVEWVRYRENGMVGFKDREGKVTLKAKYINTGNYAENGLTKVVGKNHLWGYMNYNGKMVIKPQFETASDFTSNGLARVYMNGKAGFIDESGKYVIEPRFSGGGSKEYRGAVFNEAAGVYQYETIDVKDFFSGAGDFNNNGLARVYDENTETFGFINKTGTYVIEPQFEYAEDFQEDGFAKVIQKGKITYINEKGECVNVSEPRNISTTFYAEKDIDIEKYGYVNNEGEFVIEPQFADAHDFQSNGLAWVQDAKTEKWGCIDKNGAYIIQPIFDEAGDF